MNDPIATSDSPKTSGTNAAHIFRGIAGAVIGAALGLFLFDLAFKQGYFMLALPGALLGLGCGMLSGKRSLLLAGICLILAVGVTAYADSTCYDKTFSEFLQSAGNLPKVDYLMFVAGVLFAAWFGYGKK